MASYNRVVLMGNLTRDPQLKYLPSQMPVAEFGIAINRKFKTAQGEQREEVCFVDCSAFSRTAEMINQYFRKGKPILIEGRLKYDSWEDKQGGGKRHKLSVVIESFHFVGGPGGPGGEQEGEGGGGGEEAPPARRGPAGPPQQRGGPPPRSSGPTEPPLGDEQQFKNDDIPF